MQKKIRCRPEHMALGILELGLIKILESGLLLCVF